jgi:hypothetical protein
LGRRADLAADRLNAFDQGACRLGRPRNERLRPGRQNDRRRRQRQTIHLDPPTVRLSEQPGSAPFDNCVSQSGGQGAHRLFRLDLKIFVRDHAIPVAPCGEPQGLQTRLNGVDVPAAPLRRPLLQGHARGDGEARPQVPAGAKQGGPIGRHIVDRRLHRRGHHARRDA